MMTLEHPLDDESRAFLQAVEEFSRNEVAPHADRWDHDEQLPREIFEKAGKIGLMGMVAPKEYGGRGLSYIASALAVKEVGKHCASLAMDIAAHNALSVGQINLYGTEEQKRTYLPRLTSGEWIGGWALTEPNAGSDTGGIETKAEAHEDHWHVNGLKHFITSGRVADLLVVIATTGRTDKGKNEISAFIMMKDQVTPVRKIHTYGMRASETSELRFENAKAEILGERGRGREQALDRFGSRKNQHRRARGRDRGSGLRSREFLRERTEAVRSRDRKLPGDPVDAGRLRDGTRSERSHDDARSAFAGSRREHHQGIRHGETLRLRIRREDL